MTYNQKIFAIICYFFVAIISLFLLFYLNYWTPFALFTILPVFASALFLGIFIAEQGKTEAAESILKKNERVKLIYNDGRINLIRKENGNFVVILCEIEKPKNVDWADDKFDRYIHIDDKLVPIIPSVWERG